MGTHLINYYKNDNKFNIEKLITDYQPYIYRVIKNFTNYLSNEDIEEIIEDVFLVVWHNQEKLNNTSPIEPYLIGVTKNIIKNKFRKICINENVDDYEYTFIDPIDIDFLVEQKEKNRIISLALNQMKKDDKKIFVLFYFYHKNTKEIATELNLSNTNIKIKLHRIRKRIQLKLIEGGYSYGG